MFGSVLGGLCAARGGLQLARWLGWSRMGHRRTPPLDKWLPAPTADRGAESCHGTRAPPVITLRRVSLHASVIAVKTQYAIAAMGFDDQFP